jgi:hypothetical protein
MLENGIVREGTIAVEEGDGRFVKKTIFPFRTNSERFQREHANDCIASVNNKGETER